MPINRNIYYSKIDEMLNVLRLQIETNNSANLTHLSIFAEDFYAGFFNILYDYNLTNLNLEKKNVPSVDLIDRDRKIIIQVSAVSTKEKINKALKSLGKEYETFHFKFISITKDAVNLHNKQYSVPNYITFEPQQDIYDIKKILLEIKSKDIEVIKKVFDFLKCELDDSTLSNRFTVECGNTVKLLKLKGDEVAYICYISHQKVDGLIEKEGFNVTDLKNITNWSYGKPGLIHMWKNKRTDYTNKLKVVLSYLVAQNKLINFLDCIKSDNKKGLFFEYEGRFYVNKREWNTETADENKIIEIRSDFEVNGEKAILILACSTKYFSEASQDGKYNLHSGNYHFFKGDAQPVFLSHFILSPTTQKNLFLGSPLSLIMKEGEVLI
jgi:hypothetical protein